MFTETVAEQLEQADADDHWMLGIGIGAADLVLDDIEALLLG